MLMRSEATESVGPPSFYVHCDLLCRWLALGKLLLFPEFQFQMGPSFKTNQQKKKRTMLKGEKKEAPLPCPNALRVFLPNWHEIGYFTVASPYEAS
ncbi:hypothetical protein CDAR_542781 [Caerostris darwini]|uniref:Uncharacterized protein n=1 Tax=Caerostris darwini TaxID=1538125 RepID=A0AAV4X037_9ARAC|nr:hypothetical protein CDAR_542781 [Caerostris darwini]